MGSNHDLDEAKVSIKIKDPEVVYSNLLQWRFVFVICCGQSV